MKKLLRITILLLGVFCFSKTILAETPSDLSNPQKQPALVQLTAGLPQFLPKTYDGTTRAYVNPGLLMGVAPADNGNVFLGIASANYDSKNAGCASLRVKYSLSGSAAGKYAPPIDYVGFGCPIDLYRTSMNINIESTKVYDGTTKAKFKFTLPSVVSTDVGKVIVSPTADYNDLNVCGANTITFSSPTSGSEAGNYLIFYYISVDGRQHSSGTISGKIIPKQLNVIGSKLTKTKVYDGNTNAKIIAGKLDGLVPPDVVLFSARANYLDPQIGTGKTISVSYSFSPFSLASCNYTLSSASYAVGDGVIAHGIMSAPTSVDDQTSLVASVYPNPVVDVLCVVSDIPQAKVTLIDMSGTLVLAQTVVLGKNYLDVKLLKPGTYILKMDGFVQKVVKI